MASSRYTDVAREPEREFHFPTGRASCEFEGYPDELLEPLPPEAVASYAGVSCPFRAGVIREGDRVLDIGSGSGTDALIAASMVGLRSDRNGGWTELAGGDRPPTGSARRPGGLAIRPR